jgi:hypothetical protein
MVPGTASGCGCGGGWVAETVFFFVFFVIYSFFFFCHFMTNTVQNSTWSGSGPVAVVPIDPARQRGSNGTKYNQWLWLWRWLGGRTRPIHPQNG